MQGKYFEPSQGVGLRAIIGVEAEMALQGTFKRVRICPGKGVNMPRTRLTTNGHNCNIVYPIYTCPHSPIHAGTHSATHYHTFSYNTCCFVW